jgi:hypothetical protein
MFDASGEVGMVEPPKRIEQRIIIFRPRKEDAVLLAHARECLEMAHAALSLPRPSTFLGRRDPPLPDESAESNQ